MPAIVIAYGRGGLRQDNPFREGEKEGFKGGTKVAPIGQLASRFPPIRQRLPA